MKKSESGSVHIIIAVVVGVLVVGAVGFLFWKNFIHHTSANDTVTKNTSKASDATTKTTVTDSPSVSPAASTSTTATTTTGSTSTSSSPKTTSNSTASSVPAGTKYLTINEWGVRFPYQSSDTLTSYVDPSNPSVAQISSIKLAAADGSTGSCAVNHQGGGAIGRGTANQTVLFDGVGPAPTYATYYNAHKGDSLTTKNAISVGKAGDYYYSFIHDNGSCSNNATLQDATNTLTQSIVPNVQAY